MLLRVVEDKNFLRVRGTPPQSFFRGGVTKETDDGWIDERNYIADISKAKKILA